MRWNRGLLPVAAALAVILAIFAGDRRARLVRARQGRPRLARPARGPARAADPDPRPGPADPDRGRDGRLQPGVARRGGAADRRPAARTARATRTTPAPRPAPRLSPRRLEQRLCSSRGSISAGPSSRTLLTRSATSRATQQVRRAPGASSARSSSGSALGIEPRRLGVAGSRITGIRSWIGRISSFGAQVTIAQLCSDVVARPSAAARPRSRRTRTARRPGG